VQHKKLDPKPSNLATKLNIFSINRKKRQKKPVVVAAVIFECKKGIPIISVSLLHDSYCLSRNCGLCIDMIFDMTVLCFSKKFEQQILPTAGI